MKNKNKWGLPRDIPNTVKREVRSRCGFGCVVCGCAIYEYEHVDPVFADAQEHNPRKIVLLCGNCHNRVTRGILSKESIKEYANRPKCFTKGFSFGPFDVGKVYPEVVIGTVRVLETRTLIRVFGDPILTIDPPEQEEAPFRLSAMLADRDGNKILWIDDNEWKTPVENWDVELTGQRITIRRALRNITLRLRMNPPNTIIIEKLNMYHRGVRIICDEGNHLEVNLDDGRRFAASTAIVQSCAVGIDILETALLVGCDCWNVTFKKVHMRS